MKFNFPTTIGVSNNTILNLNDIFINAMQYINV